ncbi:hypothetical protein M153_8250002473 [Pseudoloma neurophilia]|uniref:Uncharacterized protein n=1 Tax=Pseudoloma neurophilia TaxID=146866 RepID=A0A0R0LW71_9MICR|nr:hypothetical protein M153_8250002473 [Pseudoloma neurophilia]
MITHNNQIKISLNSLNLSSDSNKIVNSHAFSSGTYNIEATPWGWSF